MIRMPRPWKHPKTGTYYYRGRIPIDVLSKLKGQKLSLEVNGILTSIKLVPTIKISLRTKDEKEARFRHSDVSSQIEKRWALARQLSPHSLTQREIIGLSGLWYLEMIREHEEDPGDPEGWDAYREPIIEALILIEEPEENEPRRGEFAPAKGLRKLEKLISVDDFLVRQNLSIDQPSREKLLQEIALALLQATETLQRRSLGDYGLDKYVSRFPKFTASCSPAQSDGITLTELFEGWCKESAPSASTVEQWRKYVASFAAFTGHQSASKVTKLDVVRWKEHLLKIGNKPKTINGSKLAALGAIYNWGTQNDRISTDPTRGVGVRRSKKAGEEMRGFDLTEASRILESATTSSNPLCRWVPLLCAQSGARVSEVCQLRTEDIGSERNIWFMHFRPEAGSLKNTSSERRVPLHPHVIASGFIEFVKTRPSGPLFYDPTKRRTGAKRPQAKIAAKRIARWVHTLGLNVGQKYRKAPNHAWRHTFRTQARNAGIQDSVVNAIEGHAQPHEGLKYGQTELPAMYDAITRITLPGVCPPRERAIPDSSAASGDEVVHNCHRASECS